MSGSLMFNVDRFPKEEVAGDTNTEKLDKISTQLCKVTLLHLNDGRRLNLDMCKSAF